MEYLLAIAIIGMGFLLLQTRNRLEKLEYKQMITSRSLNAVIFALYNKRKKEIKERLIDVSDLEEAVRVVTGQKRPEQDTPIEDLAYILGEDMSLWQKSINRIELDESIKKKRKKKEFFSEVRAKFPDRDIPDGAIYSMMHNKKEINEEELTKAIKIQELLTSIKSEK